MSKSRWSITNVLRQLRGARGSLERAIIRYGKRDLVRKKLEGALAKVNAIEAELLDARDTSRTPDRTERRAA